MFFPVAALLLISAPLFIRTESLSEDCARNVTEIRACVAREIGGEEEMQEKAQKIMNKMVTMKQYIPEIRAAAEQCLATSGCADASEMLDECQEMMAMAPDSKEEFQCRMDVMRNDVAPVMQECLGISMEPKLMLIMSMVKKMKTMIKGMEKACGKNKMMMVGVCMGRAMARITGEKFQASEMKNKMEKAKNINACIEGFNPICKDEVKKNMCGCCESEVLSNDDVTGAMDSCGAPGLLQQMHDRKCRD